MRIDEIKRFKADQAQNLQTAEQMRAFLEDNEVELTDEQLECIVGGGNFVQAFKTFLGPYLYPPCPCGGNHKFEDFTDPLGQVFDKVRCVKCGTVY